MAVNSEFGEVMSVEGPLVKVRMKEHASCSKCGHQRICFPAGRHRVLIARTSEGISEGQTVSVLFRSGPAIVSSLLIFVGSVFVPLATWLAADLAGAPRWTVFTLAGVSLAIYWTFLYFLNRRLRRSGWFLPRAERPDVIAETEEK